MHNTNAKTTQHVHAQHVHVHFAPSIFVLSCSMRDKKAETGPDALHESGPTCKSTSVLVFLAWSEM